MFATKSEFLYQNIMLSVLKEKEEANKRGERIYLIVISAWMCQHIKHLTTIKDNIPLTFLGYRVKIIDEICYNEPIKFITGK